MNRKEFLEELNDRLKLIPKEDREDAITYYDEYIGDSGLDDEADVVALLGTPKAIASKIIADCTVRYATDAPEKKPVRNTATTIKLAILGVASLPVSLPIAIVALVLVLSLLISIITVILSVGVAGISLGLGGIACVFVFPFFANSFAQTITVIGMGLVGIGIGVLTVIGSIALGKLLKKLIAGIASAISDNKKRKDIVIG